MGPVASVSRTAARTTASSLVDSVRDRIATTPGRLVMIAVAVVASAVFFGVVATGAEHSRAQAAQVARSQTEPLLVSAATLYTTLSDANATVTTTFLKGGLEPRALRAHYLEDLRRASNSLATLTREVGGSQQARSAITTITEQLPVYAGEVESARANNRQGLPVGAAYLRQASALLTGTILPNADLVFATEAQRLTDDYGTGTATAALVVLIAALLVALALLIVAQVYVARVSHRTLNVGMLLATVVLAGVSIWAVIGFIGEQNALGRARRASDAVEVLSATKVLLSRAQSDQSLTLVSRGSDESDPLDFGVVTGVAARLLTEVGAVTREPQASTTASFVAYERLSHQVATLEKHGQLIAASTRAQAASAIAAKLDLSLSRQITAAQGRFARAAADATSSLSGLLIAIPVLTAVAAVLALLGIRPRLEEYR